MRAPDQAQAEGTETKRVAVMVRLDPEQAAALRKEAIRRAGEAGSAKPDLSGIVREAIDAWFTKRK
jgi:hypothetical protein